MRKISLIICALTLSSLGILSAKSYDVHLVAPAKAGATELKPGDYSIKVEGNQVVFKNSETSKSFNVPVKVGQSDRKFDNTSLETTNVGGMDTIEAIDLGGSTTRLEVTK